jgi:translation initiation factor IF-1
MDRASLFCFIGSVSAWRSAGCRLDRQIARSHDKQMEEHIEVEGRILTVLAGTMFRVELDNKHQVLATISGKMRKRFVRLIVGDRVKMEMSPYDLNKARIVWRLG